MENLDRMKLYLNIPLNDGTQDLLLEMLMEDALFAAAAYTNRSYEYISNNRVGISAATKLAVVEYNRRGTEGMKSQSFAGSNESYIDDLPGEVKAQLNTLRQVTLL